VIEIALHKDKATLELSSDELRILNNALNEVLNGIVVPEFDTRMGASRAEVGTLLGLLRKTLDRMLETGKDD
jgi:hypothetical protein